jgi:hypothetical protein
LRALHLTTKFPVGRRFAPIPIIRSELGECGENAQVRMGQNRKMKIIAIKNDLRRA